MNADADEFSSTTDADGRPIRILLVEDNPADVRLTREPAASPNDDSAPAPWTRREAVKALGPAGLAGAMPWLSSPSHAEEKPSAPERPNILFIVADDHAYGGLCGYEGRLLDTLHLSISSATSTSSATSRMPTVTRRSSAS